MRSSCLCAIWKFSLDEATHPWGIKVERVEIKDVKLPVQLQRAMAAEAEASREARAKVSFIISPKAQTNKGNLSSTEVPVLISQHLHGTPSS